MKNKQKANNYYSGGILNWIMKQNAFVVIITAAFFLFLGYRSVSGSFYSTSKTATPVPVVTALPVKASPSIKPVIIRATHLPLPTPSPSSEPMVYCMYLSKCGGDKLTTLTECNNTICCEVEQGSFQIVTHEKCQQALDLKLKKYKEELAKESDEYKKKLDEYLIEQKKYYDSLTREIELSQPVINSPPPSATYVPTYNSAELYKKCVSNATEKAAAQARATGVGDCFGEGCATTQLEYDKKTCLILYGDNL